MTLQVNILNVQRMVKKIYFGKRGADMVLAPGMVFTIEPMINAGSHEIFIDENDGWTVLTADGSLSVQCEHKVLITEEGIEVISK